MIPNVAPQPSFPDHRSPVRSGATRPKPIPSLTRLHDINGTPKGLAEGYFPQLQSGQWRNAFSLWTTST
jgi:hypothetical protein